jgi:hypothetical protein
MIRALAQTAAMQRRNLCAYTREGYYVLVGLDSDKSIWLG